MRGAVSPLNVYCGGAMIEFASGRKNLQFDGFLGRKPPSSRQGQDRWQFFFGAFNSYYEEGDRGQKNNSQKNR